MRRSVVLAFSAIALAACASGGSESSSSQASGGWTFAYDAATGVSTATQTSEGGDVSARVTCQAPSGDMVVTDYVIGAARGSRGQQQVQFKVGQESITVRGESDGRALRVNLPRRPPNLGAYAHLSRDAVSLTAGGRTHTYAEGALEKIALVANSCWVNGS
jgi:hypothetical protein